MARHGSLDPTSLSVSGESLDGVPTHTTHRAFVSGQAWRHLTIFLTGDGRTP